MPHTMPGSRMSQDKEVKDRPSSLFRTMETLRTPPLLQQCSIWVLATLSPTCSTRLNPEKKESSTETTLVNNLDQEILLLMPSQATMEIILRDEPEILICSAPTASVLSKRTRNSAPIA